MAHPPPAPRTRRTEVALLLALTAAAGAATMLAPEPLAALGGGRPADMTAAVGTAFVDFWNAGTARVPSDLASLTDYWQRFHLVKASLAVLLTVVASFLTITLYRPTGDGADGRSGPHPLRAVPAALVVGFALVVVAANVQGAVAPLSSLMPFLSGSGDPRVAAVMEQASARLAADHGTSLGGPLKVLVDDFAAYHRVFAGIAGVLTAGAACGAALLGRAAVRAPAGARIQPGTGAATLLVVAVLAGTICAANLGSAADPAQALALFFDD